MKVEVYDRQKFNKEIGFIKYDIRTGQVGLLFITNRKFEGYKIGTQLLQNSMKEMKLAGNQGSVGGHEGKSRVLVAVKGFCQEDLSHSSVTGSGYYRPFDTYHPPSCDCPLLFPPTE